MQVIYFPGVWDLLHVGHVRALEYAKHSGKDRYLIVGVPSDEVVKLDKGDPPIIADHERCEMIRALKCVNDVIMYHELDFIRELEARRPGYLAISEKTWGEEERHKRAEEWLKQNGSKLLRVPYSDCISSTDVKNRCYLQLRSKSITEVK